MKTFFLIAFLTSSLFLYAQIPGDASDNVNIFIDGNSNLSMVTFKEADIITDGNIYLFPEWVGRAKLLTKSGRVYIVLGLNYNIKEDNFEIKISKDSIFKLDSNYIDHININGAIFKKIDFKSIDNHFVEVLFKNNNISFLKKFQIRLLKGKLNPLDGIWSPNKYHIYYHYYYVQNGSVTKIKLNKKEIFSILKGRPSLIKNYVNKNRISYKKESDIIRLLKFSETL